MQVQWNWHSGPALSGGARACRPPKGPGCTRVTPSCYQQHATASRSGLSNPRGRRSRPSVEAPVVLEGNARHRSATSGNSSSLLVAMRGEVKEAKPRRQSQAATPPRSWSVITFNRRPRGPSRTGPPQGLGRTRNSPGQRACWAPGGMRGRRSLQARAAAEAEGERGSGEGVR